MHRTRLCYFLAFSLGACFCVSGCGQPGATSDSKLPPAALGSDAAKPPADDEETRIVQALAELSPGDRYRAEKQRICPVSGHRLGSMDKPVKVTVEGEDVFLCCSGCEDDLKSDPQKYLAKVKK